MVRIATGEDEALMQTCNGVKIHAKKKMKDGVSRNFTERVTHKKKIGDENLYCGNISLVSAREVTAVWVELEWRKLL